MTPERPTNGNREWLWRLAMMVGAALVAYYTAIGAVQRDVAIVTEREMLHFQEILRRLDAIERKLP